jgi:hypothetical protein
MGKRNEGDGCHNSKDPGGNKAHGKQKDTFFSL